MISEGSCDTEDWRNDAENSALITEINYIFNYIKIANSYSKLIISNNLTALLFYSVFDQIKWILGEHNTFLQKSFIYIVIPIS